jgi:hypothetical protein
VTVSVQASIDAFGLPAQALVAEGHRGLPPALILTRASTRCATKAGSTRMRSRPPAMPCSTSASSAMCTASSPWRVIDEANAAVDLCAAALRRSLLG